MSRSPSSPEDVRLAALSKELDAAVARINVLQGGGNGGGSGAAEGVESSSTQAVSTAARSPTSTSASSPPSTQKPPLRARASSHFARHGSRLTSALLAGCAFAVAAGRLSDAREQREKEELWEAERADLEARAEAAEAALREAMARMKSRETGGGGSGGGGSGGSRSWSSSPWWLPFSAARREGGGGSEGSSPPPPPPPPKPLMI